MEVNNKFLSFFWDNLDYPIRFIYARTPFFSKILFWRLYSSDFISLDRRFEEILQVLQKFNVPIKDRAILEIGPGNSNIIAFNFLMNGAKKVILVDKFPRNITTQKQKEYFNEEIEYIRRKYDRELFFIQNGIPNSKYVEYISNELTKTELTDIDFIYSNSVLEHVKNVEDNIAFMSTILNENGYMYHNIDLRDHYNFRNPFLFYKYDDLVWDRYLTKEGISYTNRMRYDDYCSVFKSNGFKILHTITEKEQLNQKKLGMRFKNKDKTALEITKLRVLLSKNS